MVRSPSHWRSLSLTLLSVRSCWTTFITCSTRCSNSSRLFLTASSLFRPIVSGCCSICCNNISSAGLCILRWRLTHQIKLYTSAWPGRADRRDFNNKQGNVGWQGRQSGSQAVRQSGKDVSIMCHIVVIMRVGGALSPFALVRPCHFKLRRENGEESLISWICW